MLQFHLFRTLVAIPDQVPLFEPARERGPILGKALRSLPSVEGRRGSIWHVGNLVEIDASAFSFRLGRTTKTTLALYEEGEFVDRDFDTAPYTHAVLDVDLELFAVAHNPKIAKTAVGIARQFAKLLRESEPGKQAGIDVDVHPMSDPVDFIKHLADAYEVNRFWITFSPPNPLDADRDFHKPMQKLLKDACGQKGRTEIAGESLDATSLEELARSAAATGENASAYLRPQESAEGITRTLRGNPAVISVEEDVPEQRREELLARLRGFYERIRGSGRDQ